MSKSSSTSGISIQYLNVNFGFILTSPDLIIVKMAKTSTDSYAEIFSYIADDYGLIPTITRKNPGTLVIKKYDHGPIVKQVSEWDRYQIVYEGENA